MEQQAKLKWDLENPKLPNPYEQLPEVQMYTFEMKHKEKFIDENKAFNFREFFRVDDEGELVYKADVRRFWIISLTQIMKRIIHFQQENIVMNFVILLAHAWC